MHHHVQQWIPTNLLITMDLFYRIVFLHQFLECYTQCFFTFFYIRYNLCMTCFVFVYVYVPVMLLRRLFIVPVPRHTYADDNKFDLTCLEIHGQFFIFTNSTRNFKFNSTNDIISWIVAVKQQFNTSEQRLYASCFQG